jgi:hypothetical protein
MQKLIVMVLLGIGMSGMAFAVATPAPVPEIDPASGMSALALLGGAVLMLRGRRKSQSPRA